MISKEKFVKILNKIKTILDFQDELVNLSTKYHVGDYFDYPDMICESIDLLNQLCELDNNLPWGSDIDYFVFELNCGRKYTEGCVIDEEGRNVDMSSAEKLYDYLAEREGITYMNINIDEILIPYRFQITVPNQKKYDTKKENYLKTNTYKAIELDRNFQLVDGYITYLILKELGVEEVVVKMPNKSDSYATYVYGVHPNSLCKKEYVWKLSKRMAKKIGAINTGMILFAEAKNKISPIIVTKIEQTDVPPRLGKIKNIIGGPKYDKETV